VPYLILDPVGQYPRQLLHFLGGQAKKAGVAVFTDRMRWMIWRDKWSKELGDYVIDAFLAPQFPSTAALAREIAGKYPSLEGVIPWDEETVLLGARLSDLLGLDWNSLQVMERCRDKAVMKAWLRKHAPGRINASATVTEGGAALAFQRQVGHWPIVVKPTAGSGSEDVYFPASGEELLRDCQRVMESGSGEVLLEEYIGGEELVINGLVDANSDLLVTDVWAYDRRESHGIPNLFYQTFKVGTGAPLFAGLMKYAADVVEALQLRRCPIHMEVKIDDRGPCLIEVGARFGGGNLAILGSKLHGRSLLELAACQYLANMPIARSDVDFDRYDRMEARVVHGIQSRELPRISRVHGADEVRAMPSFDGFGKLRAVGTRAPLTRDLDSASWELYLFHDSLAQVDHDAAQAHRILRYE
jgi:hypothetical protein